MEDQGLHLLTPHAQHLGDLRVRLVAELEQDQRGALVRAQAAYLLEEFAQFLAPLDLIRRPIQR
ncbi:MAG TPA: hypothetical protein VMP89_16430 [Solirubrobacteraceae bacterium]|nr:hypothetical protein [Solirubrobacteraceae bacterium]